jgi:uncharacterized membrane protein YkvA (DUF1232 family)
VDHPTHPHWLEETLDAVVARAAVLLKGLCSKVTRALHASMNPDLMRAMRRDVVALWLAGRDRRVPWYAKAVAAAVVAYALSPIDLIPDFVPVLGYLDDLLIVPLGVLLAIRLVPPAVMAELRLKAEATAERPMSVTGAAVIAAVWAGAIAMTVWLFWQG